jgi:hypothetical protein
MICNNLSETIGFACCPLTDDGSVALIRTPFQFEDGEAVPVFVERIGPQLRFFDDGGVLLHFLGRGVRLQDQRNLKFIKNLAEPEGVTLNQMGELEIFSPHENASGAFAKYIGTLLALASWEREQNGVATDLSLLLDEVEQCLRSWKPDSTIVASPEYRGVSGYTYKLDFSVDGEAVIAISPHPSTVSATAKKLLDIRATTDNTGLQVLVVIDDRRDADTASREGRILDSVANVMMMSRLEKKSGHLALTH